MADSATPSWGYSNGAKVGSGSAPKQGVGSSGVTGASSGSDGFRKEFYARPSTSQGMEYSYVAHNGDGLSK